MMKYILCNLTIGLTALLLVNGLPVFDLASSQLIDPSQFDEYNSTIIGTVNGSSLNGSAKDL